MVSLEGLSLIFKSLPYPCVILRPDSPRFTVLAVNDAFQTLHTRSADDILGSGFFEGWSQHSPSPDLCNSFQTALNEKSTNRLVLKNFSRFFESENIAVPDESGDVAYILHTLKDVAGPSEFAERINRIDELEQLERKVFDMNCSENVSLEEVLRFYVGGIEQLFPQMQCSLLRVEDAHLYCWSAPSLPAEYIAQTTGVPIGDKMGSCGTAAYFKEMVIAEDIATDPRWAQFKNIALQYNLRACWSYPIMNVRGEVIATFGMYYQTVREPDADELKIIDRATFILKILIENHQHLNKIEEATVLMEQAQELAGFGNWSWKLDTNEVDWSSSLCSMFGIRDEGIKRRYEDYIRLVHPDDVKRVSTYLSEGYRNSTEIRYEARIVRPDGQIRHHKTWAKLHKDKNGDRLRLIGACLDITDSKLIQEKLRISESRLRSLVESQTNYVIRTDLEGKYTYFNKKYKEDFGWLHPEGSLIGRDSTSSVLPHHLSRVYDTAELCRLNPNKVFPVELDKYSRDGKPRSTIWHFICLTDLAGNPAEIQCIGIDNTESKLAQDELKASHKRYRELFHLSPQPMWVYELDTLKFLDVNEAAIRHYGYSREEFLSMDLRALRLKEDVPSLLSAVERSKSESGLVQHGIFKHRKKDGTIICVDMLSNAIPYEDKATHIVLVNDITERLHYINAIEEQNQRFKEIAWMHSHVMRTPVARIMSLVELLHNGQNTVELNTELLDYILQSAHELDKIIRDISDQTKH